MKIVKAAAYGDAVRRLEALAKSQGMVFGLENTLKFDAALGHPSKAFKSVHVAGTNGKGSVAGKIARSLTLAGYRTGLYTSPHVLSYCERIEIDGRHISPEGFAGLVEEGFAVKEARQLDGTAFELLTAVSFQHFCRERAEVVVAEVGLGGRLDSTNILTPKASVVTSIGFDHTHILGNTLTEIAKEKAGIIKPGVPVIVGPNVPVPVLREVAESLKSDYLPVPPSSHFETSDQENSRIARTALTRLTTDFPRLTAECIENGLKYRPKGRKQELTCGKARLIIDTGHNHSALSRLFFDLAHEYPKYKFHAVMGISADKEVYECVEEVLKNVEKAHFVSTDAGRLVHFSKLWQLGMEIDPYVVGVSGQVKDVLGQLIDTAEPRQLLIICGSFYIMPAVEEQLQLRGVSLAL